MPWQTQYGMSPRERFHRESSFLVPRRLYPLDEVSWEERLMRAMNRDESECKNDNNNTNEQPV